MSSFKALKVCCSWFFFAPRWSFFALRLFNGWQEVGNLSGGYFLHRDEPSSRLLHSLNRRASASDSAVVGVFVGAVGGDSFHGGER